jgi:peroxiredoxin
MEVLIPKIPESAGRQMSVWIRASIPILLAWLAAVASAQTISNTQASSIGAKVGVFSLSDSSGRTHSLRSYAGKVLVLVFWSYKCPVALAYNERFIALQAKYANRGVAILGVASNSNETAPEINRNAANLKVNFPILIDSEGVLADSLGATHTPSAFIIDQAGNLRYQGAFDNNKKEGSSGREAYVDNAIDDLLAGKTVGLPETKAFGCIIQRKNG